MMMVVRMSAGCPNNASFNISVRLRVVILMLMVELLFFYRQYGRRSDVRDFQSMCEAQRANPQMHPDSPRRLCIRFTHT